MAEIVNDLNPNVQNLLDDPALRVALGKTGIEPGDVAVVECRPWMVEALNEDGGSLRQLNRANTQEGYDSVIQGILATIAGRTDDGLQTQALFVPNFRIPDYCTWQLDRLAQDIGRPVFAQITPPDRPSAERPVLTFRPNAEGFWDAAEARIIPSPDTSTINTTNQDAAARGNITHIAKNPDNCQGALLELAKSPPHTLWSQLHSAKWDDELSNVGAMSPKTHETYEAALAGVHEALRGYAFGDPGGIGFAYRAAARKILAIINDVPARTTLMQELNIFDYRNAELSAVPLGLYLEHDADFFEKYLARVEHAAVRGLANSDDLPLMVSALLRSKRPAAGTFVVQQLAIHQEHGDASAKILAPLLDALPAYIDDLWLQPDTPQTGAALHALQDVLCQYLETSWQQAEAGRQPRQAETVPAPPAPHHAVAEILFKFSDPRLKNLLARHVRNLFGEVGSDVRNPTFVRHYLKYRAHFGSLPDIDAHVEFGSQDFAPNHLT